MDSNSYETASNGAKIPVGKTLINYHVASVQLDSHHWSFISTFHSTYQLTRTAFRCSFHWSWPISLIFYGIVSADFTASPPSCLPSTRDCDQNWRETSRLDLAGGAEHLSRFGRRPKWPETNLHAGFYSFWPSLEFYRTEHTITPETAPRDFGESEWVSQGRECFW